MRISVMELEEDRNLTNVLWHYTPLVCEVKSSDTSSIQNTREAFIAKAKEMSVIPTEIEGDVALFLPTSSNNSTMFYIFVHGAFLHYIGYLHQILDSVRDVPLTITLYERFENSVDPYAQKRECSQSQTYIKVLTHDAELMRNVLEDYDALREACVIHFVNKVARGLYFGYEDFCRFARVDTKARTFDVIDDMETSHIRKATTALLRCLYKYAPCTILEWSLKDGELWLGIKPECDQSAPYAYVYNDAACYNVFNQFIDELKKPYEKRDWIAFVNQCAGDDTRSLHHEIMAFIRENGCYIVSPGGNSYEFQYDFVRVNSMKGKEPNIMV